jgi:hypothetical protein
MMRRRHQRCRFVREQHRDAIALTSQFVLKSIGVIVRMRVCA